MPEVMLTFLTSDPRQLIMYADYSESIPQEPHCGSGIGLQHQLDLAPAGLNRDHNSGCFLIVDGQAGADLPVLRLLLLQHC